MLIGGDFNLTAGDAEEVLLPPGFDDIWLQCCPQDLGYTWNPRRNALARKHGWFFSKPARFRSDAGQVSRAALAEGGSGRHRHGTADV